MNKFYRLALVLAASLAVSGQAAEEASARTRAYVYQHEARTVLESRNWHVSRDQTGELVADHWLGLMGAGGGSQMLGLTASPMPSNGPFKALAWLTLTFTPVSVTRTKCTANIVAYTYWRTLSDEGKKRIKPKPFNNPDSTKEIQDIMLKAEARLTAQHPEYAQH